MSNQSFYANIPSELRGAWERLVVANVASGSTLLLRYAEIKGSVSGVTAAFAAKRAEVFVEAAAALPAQFEIEGASYERGLDILTQQIIMGFARIIASGEDWASTQSDIDSILSYWHDTRLADAPVGVIAVIQAMHHMASNDEARERAVANALLVERSICNKATSSASSAVEGTRTSRAQNSSPKHEERYEGLPEDLRPLWQSTVEKAYSIGEWSVPEVIRGYDAAFLLELPAAMWSHLLKEGADTLLADYAVAIAIGVFADVVSDQTSDSSIVDRARALGVAVAARKMVPPAGVSALSVALKKFDSEAWFRSKIAKHVVTRVGLSMEESLVHNEAPIERLPLPVNPISRFHGGDTAASWFLDRIGKGLSTTGRKLNEDEVTKLSTRYEDSDPDCIHRFSTHGKRTEDLILDAYAFERSVLSVLFPDGVDELLNFYHRIGNGLAGGVKCEEIIRPEKGDGVSQPSLVAEDSVQRQAERLMLEPHTLLTAIVANWVKHQSRTFSPESKSNGCLGIVMAAPALLLIAKAVEWMFAS